MITEDWKVPIHRRVGKFMISRDAVERDPLKVLAIMARCIVVRCEMLYQEQAFEYVAYSWDFMELEEGKQVPEYLWQFETSGPALIRARAELVTLL